MVVSAVVYYLGRFLYFICFSIEEKQIKGNILDVVHFVDISGDNLLM